MPRHTCHFCPNPVNTTQPGTYRLIEGWAELRTKGGTNAVTMPSTPKAFAHRECVERAQKGIPPGQGVLL